MSCEETREWMSEHLDGVLDKDTDEKLKKHLAGCEDCRRELDALRETVSLLHGLEPVEPPADLLRGIHSKLKERPRPRIRYVLSLPQARVALAAGLLLAMVGIYSLRETTVPPADQGVRVAQAEKADEAPAMKPHSAPKETAEVRAPAPSGAEVKGEIWRAQEAGEKKVKEVPSDEKELPVLAGVTEKDDSFKAEEADDGLMLREAAAEMGPAKTGFAKGARLDEEVGARSEAGGKESVEIVIASAETARVLRIIKHLASRGLSVSRLERKKAAGERTADGPLAPARKYRVETETDGRTIIYAGIPSKAYRELLRKLRGLGKLSVGKPRRESSKALEDADSDEKDEDVIAIRITILPQK